MKYSNNHWHTLLVILLVSFITILLSCGGDRVSSVNVDLEKIKERGKLVAITGYSATSYFIYRGKTMGYEYELLTRLADHLDLELEIKIENDFDTIFDKLNQGEADIIGYGLTITQQRKEKVNFTEPLYTTQQVLVQRKPENWRKMKLHQIEDSLLRTPAELINKTVHVKQASSYYERLKHLSKEIGGKIDILEVDGDTSTEQMIRKVANGEIDYTVADQNIALINKAYYLNIDVKTPISLPQRIGWAVRKNSPNLLKALNSWISEMKQGTPYYVIYNKYFKNRGAYVRRAKSEYLSVSGGKISAYDEIIKEKAKVINWDWRLLAALIYKESQFKPRAKSWSGAVGLMQVLPRTARHFGIKNLRDPYKNIEAGVQQLNWLENYWKDKIDDKDERLKFILGSYNVGHGHVQDARKLAEKYGRDPNKWEGNVAYYLLHLSDEKYFTDEVVDFGYCRGIEPFNYVKDIYKICQHYKKVIVA